MPSLSHILVRHDSDRLVRQEAERSAGHPDYEERARVLSDVWWQAHRRGLSAAQVHDVCGLSQDSLGDCSLSTELLHAALAHVQALPDSILAPARPSPAWRALGWTDEGVAPLFGGPSSREQP